MDQSPIPHTKPTSDRKHLSRGCRNGCVGPGSKPVFNCRLRHQKESGEHVCDHLFGIQSVPLALFVYIGDVLIYPGTVAESVMSKLVGCRRDLAPTCLPCSECQQSGPLCPSFPPYRRCKSPLLAAHRAGYAIVSPPGGPDVQARRALHPSVQAAYSPASGAERKAASRWRTRSRSSGFSLPSSRAASSSRGLPGSSLSGPKPESQLGLTA